MEDIAFLNVDLDLESGEDLSLLIDDFGDSVIVMNNIFEGDIYKVSIELAGLQGDSGYLFREYFKLLDNMSAQAKCLWDRCSKKKFDLGFQSGAEPMGITENIPLEVISKLSEYGASVAITVYAVCPS